MTRAALHPVTPSAGPGRRLLFVEASIGGVIGGSLTGIVQVMRRLDRDRFAPAVVVFERKEGLGPLEANGVPVHVLPELPVPLAARTGVRLGRALVRGRELVGVIAPRTRALVNLFRRERPAMIYVANGITTNLDAVLAGALCRLPVLSHEKGFRRVGPIERFMSRWVETCVCMTHELAEYYRSKRFRPRRFLTIYDGIDCEEFAPGGGLRVRREFGIPADAPVVGIVGHIQSWKGQLLVVEAFARALAAQPALRCLVVGGVHRLGVEYAARLRARIEAEGLGERVMLTGARTDVPACMDAMDVVIHASTRREPFGRVL